MFALDHTPRYLALVGVFLLLKVMIFKCLLSGFEVVAWWLLHRKKEGGRERGRERVRGWSEKMEGIEEGRRNDGEREGERDGGKAVTVCISTRGSS